MADHDPYEDTPLGFTPQRASCAGLCLALIAGGARWIVVIVIVAALLA